MKNIVAIVGRPNVGKSTLFNRIIGKRIAIVHHRSGVTRDRNYAEVNWQGKRFLLIDTGGFVPESDNLFDKHIQNQIKQAIDEADIFLFIVDGKTGLHPIDSEIANLLRKKAKEKEVILVVNKIDSLSRELNVTEFYKLGFEKPHIVSSLNGRNVAELIDYFTRDIPQYNEDIRNRDNRPKFAIIGKPNTGKSSLLNAILKEERNIVTDIPGTTRDSIDSILKYYGKEIVLIDTAGIVKKSKLPKTDSLDFYSIVRTYRAIERCDIALLVIDASQLFKALEKFPKIEFSNLKLDKQDIGIINDVVSLGKGLLIIINKWDLIEKDSQTALIVEKKIKSHLQSFGFLKIIFISALTKKRIHKVLEEAVEIYNEYKKSIKTSLLNQKILTEIKNNPPPSVKGRDIKINYITQTGTAPPSFVFFSNEPKLIMENYKRFLEKKIRENFGFGGVPFKMIFKKKN